MNASKPPKRRPGRPKGSHGQSRFRVVPVWKQDFDQAGFARALLLLAMHLDENKSKSLNEGQNGNTHEGGGDHE